jgi:hypothetical protein
MMVMIVVMSVMVVMAVMVVTPSEVQLPVLDSTPLTLFACSHMLRRLLLASAL